MTRGAWRWSRSQRAISADGSRQDRRRDQRLAQASSHGRPHDAHAVFASLGRKLGQVPVGQNGHLVPARGQPLGQMLDVEGQARDVRPVVVQGHQDLHFGRWTRYTEVWPTASGSQKRIFADRVGPRVAPPLQVADHDVGHAVLLDDAPGDPGIAGGVEEAHLRQPLVDVRLVLGPPEALVVGPAEHRGETRVRRDPGVVRVRIAARLQDDRPNGRRSSATRRPPRRRRRCASRAGPARRGRAGRPSAAAGRPRR